MALRALLLPGVLAALVGCKAPQPKPYTGTIGKAPHFCAVGDLQRTSVLEFWRERNDPERRRVVAALVRQRPAFLLSLGDLVFDGASPRQWGRLDTLLAPVRKAGIALWPVPGNHEYWGPNRAAMRNYFARFPHLKKRHYHVLRFQSLAVVMLDSNHKDLGKKRWAAQLHWYRRTLAKLDADKGVRGVLVVQHHPPYTNSTVTGDEDHVKRGLVPPFMAARKTLIMLSGHAHSYERFERGGKMFVVSGGGGGPRARLAQGAQRRHPDDRYAGPALRRFNYLCFYPQAKRLRVVVHGLRKSAERFDTMETFSTPLSPY